MARFVVYDSERQQYLMPRGSYWERKDRAEANNGDQTKWSADLQKARVFSNRSAASNADAGDASQTIGRIRILEVRLTMDGVPDADG